MQRSLYPLMLVFAAAGAVAVCLQPSVAEEMMTLAQTLGRSGYPQAGTPYGTTGFDASVPGPPHSPIPTTRAAARSLPAASETHPMASESDRGYAHPAPPYNAGQAVVGSPIGTNLPPGAPYAGAMPAAVNSWAAPAERPDAPASPPQTPPPPCMAGCEGAQILAQVGGDVILASEVSAGVNEIIELNKDRIPPDQIEMQRKALTQQLLKQRIQYMLIYQDAKRTIPDENLQKIRERVSEQYDKVVIPQRIEAAGVSSRQELDAKLAELGTSLERERRTFIERTLAQQWAREQVQTEKEATPDEMVNYYREHIDEFTHPARARWQQLTVRKASHPSKAAAFAAIAALGNQVMGGVPFEQVAKAHSEGSTAAIGGTRDWTSRGALVCAELDDALFGLPVGKLSRIIEDDDAYHIIRVVEREDTSITPFRDAQVEIKEKLADVDGEAQLQKYIARLEQEIPVQTVFDGEDPHEDLARRPTPGP